jgi:hypothetical protein
VGTGVLKKLVALLVEDVDLRAEEITSRSPSPAAAPGVGLVRKPTKESEWHDVPPIDSVRLFERQLARRRE